MKDYIKGRVIAYNKTSITIENQGIGYKFAHYNLPNWNHGVLVCIYLAEFHSDFQTTTYGFENQEERDLFADLVAIKSVGPKTAISLLLKFKPTEWLKIIKNQDFETIMQLKGVGTFTARMILTELSAKYFAQKLSPKQLSLALALEKMGYERKKIYPLLTKIDERLSLEELTKKLLQMLGKTSHVRI